MIELEQFVKVTLLSIIRGAQGAMEDARTAGGMVNPYVVGGTLGPETYNSERIFDVQFDVAISAGTGRENQAGAGVFVAAFGIGARETERDEANHLSRVKFVVPISLKTQKL